MIRVLACLSLFTASLAQAKPTAEALEGWKSTRWHIEMEQTLPVPVELAATFNHSFRTRGLQVRAVVSCPTFERYGKSKASLTCRFEELSVKATPRRLNQAPTVYAQNERVIADVETRLKEHAFEVVVSADGRIVSVDLPELEWRNRRESENREVLRRIVYDLVAPWHLRRDDEWKLGFVERNSVLIRAPGQPGGTGRSKMEHSVSEVEGRRVLQSKAKGGFTAPYEPFVNGQSGLTEESVALNDSDGRGAGNPSASVGSVATSGAPGSQSTTSIGLDGARNAEAPTDYTFTGELTSVAVVDDHGRVTERVWAMLGKPTASSLGNFQNASVWYAGHARELDEGERPAVGTSGLVAPPGVKTDRVPAWVPLSTF
ncbi:MAG: hypothetical protein KTR31_19565 [Myxococcales bacterium]|nr:hypothetical protein [Myxococcales bacterium]